MKIIITGGAGFIGKHLADFLLNEKHEVTILDNFSNSTKESINSLVSKGVNVIEGDITNSEFISKAFEKQEVVIHLAAKISVDESIKNPSETHNVNVEGTKIILNSCKENRIKKLVAASSAAVYGESTLHKKIDEKTLTNPISPYGESKVRMELEIEKFSKENNLNYTILRFFNIFGIGQSPEYAGVITKFIDRINQNKSLQIFGDGLQTRDFISIRDIIQAINNSLFTKKNGKYNVASGKTTTIKKLAELMISMSGKELEIEFLEEKKGDIKFSEADISLAKKEIEFLPKIGIEDIKNFL